MDEQNNQENNEVKPEVNEPKHQCMKQDCWKKCIAMTLAAFLGGFLAVYFVADNFYHHKFKNCRYHKMRTQRFNNFDNSLFYTPDYAQNEIKRIENEQARMMKEFEKTPWSMVPMFANPIKVRAYYDEDKFKVVVDTKNFDKDDSKIEYKINGRKLTVWGKSEVKDKGFESDVSFSQDIILPEKINANDAQVSQDNNNWVLTIPVFMK